MSCVLTPLPGTPYPEGDEDEEIVGILMYHDVRDFLRLDRDALKECPVTCVIIDELDERTECWQSVAALLLSPMRAERASDVPPDWMAPGRPRVVLQTEAGAHWPIAGAWRVSPPHEETWWWSFHPNATIRQSYYLGPEWLDGSLFPPGRVPPARRSYSSRGLVAIFVSNCDSKWVQSRRGRFIVELAKHVPVASYGKCFHNADPDPEEAALLEGMPWWESKWHLSSRHKFVLALENAEEPDYVTEKLFHAFVAGSVPVYGGAPNVEEYLPSRRSAIRVDDHPSPRDLAEYLLYLDAHDEVYQRYFDWWDEPLSPAMTALAAYSPRSAPCRLCQALAAGKVGVGI